MLPGDQMKRILLQAAIGEDLSTITLIGIKDEITEIPLRTEIQTKLSRSYKENR